MKALVNLSLCLTLFVFFLCNIGFTLGFSCKDENNNDIDWFINYKLPKIEDENSRLQNGEAYAYITPGNLKWTLSSNSVKSTNSMLGRTVQVLTDNINNDDVTYLFYNDQPPGASKSAVGHLKGILGFKGKKGFWLIHSIPNYSRKDKHEYPENGLVNGQTAICVNFDASALNDICNHLLYCNPNIYERRLSDSLSSSLDSTAKSLFSSKPEFRRSEPFVKKATVKSVGNQMFNLFAKDNQLEEDLYSSIIAPSLKSSLIVETWRNGAGGVLDPSCKSDYSVVDITAIKMKVSNRGKEIYFKSSEDHSKWAVSDEESNSWVCIGDLNRMASQEKRGGGAICFKSKGTWNAYKSIISETENCSTR